MTWFLYVLIGYFALNALANVANVGKPLKPVTGPAAASTVLCTAIFVTGLVMTIAELH